MHQPFTEHNPLSRDPFDIAMDFSKCGKPAQAIPYFLQVISSKPKSVGSYLGLARCYQALGEYDKAVSVYISLREKKLANFKSEISLARCYQEMGRFELSLQLLETLAEHNPHNEDISLSKACCLESMGRYTSSLLLFEYLSQSHPHDKAILLGKARCYEGLEQFKKALIIYQELEKYYPKDFAVWMSKSRLFEAMGWHEAALDILGKLNELHKNDLKLLLGQARCYEDMELYEAALKIFKRLQSLFPDNELVLIGEARCYQAMAHYNQALKTLDRLLSLSPYNKAAYLAKVHCYGEMGLHDKALAIFVMLEARLINDKSLQLAQAHCYEAAEQFEAALKYFEKLKITYPKDKFIGLSYARCFQAIGRLDTALSLFEELNQQFPQDKTILLGKARCYQEMGQFGKSLLLLESLTQLFPNNKSVLLSKARCHQLIGQYELSIESFNELNLLYPRDKTILLGEAVCYQEMSNYDRMLKSFEVLEKIYPEDRLILVSKARCYEVFGENQRALTIYEKLNTLYPNNKMVLLGLARCHENLGNYDQAFQVFTKLNSIFPEDKSILLSTAFCHLNHAQSKGNFKSCPQALHILNRVIKEFPYYLDAQIGIISYYRVTQQYDLTIKKLKETIERFPYAIIAYRFLAKCYIKVHRVELIDITYKEGLSRFPYDRPLHSDYLQHLINQKKHEETIRFYLLSKNKFETDYLYLEDLAILAQAIPLSAWPFIKRTDITLAKSTSQLMVPPEVVEIMNLLETSGYKVFIFGGSIRDQLLKLPINDFDIITNATVEMLQKLIPNCKKSIYVEGLYTLKTQTYHMDINISDLSIINHAKTLDFTINAFYCNAKGEILSPLPESRIDLEKREINIIGNYERLKDDPLRMARAVYLATKLNFVINLKVREFININANNLLQSDKTRLSLMLTKLFAQGKAKQCYMLLKDLGLLQSLFPGHTTLSSSVQSWLLEELKATDARSEQHQPVSIFYIYAVLLLCNNETAILRNPQAREILQSEDSDQIFETELKVYKRLLSLQERHVLIIRRVLNILSTQCYAHYLTEENDNNTQRLIVPEDKKIEPPPTDNVKICSQENITVEDEFTNEDIIAPPNPSQGVNIMTSNRLFNRASIKSKDTTQLMPNPSSRVRENIQYAATILHTHVNLNRRKKSTPKKTEEKSVLKTSEHGRSLTKPFDIKNYAAEILMTAIPVDYQIRTADRKKALDLVEFSLSESHIKEPLSSAIRAAVEKHVRSSIYKIHLTHYLLPSNWTSMFFCENYAINFDESSSQNAVTFLNLLQIIQDKTFIGKHHKKL